MNGEVANVQATNLSVSEFELQLGYYAHFSIKDFGKMVPMTAAAEYADCISAEG